MYPRRAGRRVVERDHVAHVEGYDVVELDALVRGGGAQPLPVLRHLQSRHVAEGPRCGEGSSDCAWVRQTEHTTEALRGHGRDLSLPGLSLIHI